LNALRAFGDGLRRVWRAPWVIAGVGLWIAAGSLPLSWPGSTMIAVVQVRDAVPHFWINLLGMPAGWNPLFVSMLGHGWFVADAAGGGAAAFLSQPFYQTVIAQIVVAVFLDGGVFDRLARDRRVGASGFFAACGGCFGRIARVGLIAVPACWLLFALAPPAAAIAAVLLINPIFGYAKVRAVVEDRRSALGSCAAALRFVRRHPLDVAVLYVLNAMLFAGASQLHLLAAGALTAPRPALFFAYALAAAVISLQFAASHISLFQGHLAHAGYTAAPVPQWPDSPAAEAIRRMQ
jgi:hypothetical protein